MRVAEDLPKVYENTTDFNHYKFTNTRDRDEFRKELLRLKAIEDERLEKASQEEGYKKKRKPVYDSQICYKSENPDDDENEYNDEEDDYLCMAKFNETIDLKAKEASVFLPVDIFDKGKKSIWIEVFKSGEFFAKDFHGNFSSFF